MSLSIVNRLYVLWCPGVMRDSTKIIYLLFSPMFKIIHEEPKGGIILKKQKSDETTRLPRSAQDKLIEIDHLLKRSRLDLSEANRHLDVIESAFVFKPQTNSLSNIIH